MRRRFQLPLQTADLIAGFMVWVILSSLLPYIKQDVYIPPDQIALVTAIPVVLGSVLRVPFGYCANLFGARAVFLTSFIVLVVPVWFLSEATTYQGLLIGGTFLGIAGAVFSVGVTSLPKYYPKERHGFVNGVYGFGNMGTALTTWLAPVAAVAFGWRMAVKLYLVLLAAFIVLNFVLGDRDEPRVKTPVMEQLRAVWSDARLWFLSLFYFVTFGAFVALTVYLPNFLTSHYGMDGVSAGVATSVFIVAAAAIRVLGGWLGDRFDCYRLLALVFRGAGHGTGAARVPGGHLSGQHRMRHRQRRGVQVGACVLHEASRDCQRHRGHDGRPGRLLSAARAVGIDAAVQHERPRICRLRRLRPRLPGDFAGHEEEDSVILRARSAQSVS